MNISDRIKLIQVIHSNIPQDEKQAIIEKINNIISLPNGIKIKVALLKHDIKK